MPTDAALLIIDAQVAILDGETPAHARDEVLAHIGELLAGARAAGVPVVYVQHDDATYEPMTPGNPGWQIHPAVAPLPGERVVRKRACDAFYGTPLRAELDVLGVTRLVVAGCETDYCVDTTVRRALSLDYDVVLAADAHTTTSGSDGGNGLTAAQIITHHNATLAGFSNPTREVVVKPTSEIAF